ncbi:MAG TPA: glyoxalase [Gammaproteobacteria bacterium]|nr:glyoxalase [Gammaproteobacteria bacterium]
MRNIVSINHVSLLVADTARALDFYQGLLGLEIYASRPELDFPGAWLTVGAGQIHLLELPATNRQAALPEHGGRDQHVAMNVTDLDAVVAALAAAGIGYTLSRSGRRALFCRDPDGNVVELVEVPADAG